ncbi:glycosyltransferase [Tatumella sp. JGM130]|uniref:glycosyltransferase n=1 Tax=Tatumella sp. JGM130 TaxID=2799797 RepID=UPI001BAEC802|nr:glycosyltransferase [Tatumella sp. JGM130]MBS0893263.1 glycosyltransferase [Tatumella sp. JGM130]
MKKIIFLTHSISGRGGMENVTRQVINLLIRNGYLASIYIIENEDKIKDFTWLDGIKKNTSKAFSKNRKLQNFIHKIKLKFFLNRENPDLIICMNTVPCMIARAALDSSSSKAKLSTWMHLPPLERYRPHYLKLADHHFAISNGIKGEFKELGEDERKISVIFNPIKRNDHTITPVGIMKFLYVGRVLFEDQKRIKDLLLALSEIKNFCWTLDIVGDGSDIQTCKDFSGYLGLSESVTWHGWQGDCWGYIETEIKNTSCLLLTSRHEGLPLVLLEAISRGIPCISSDCMSGPADIINQDNGLLFEPMNISDLVEKINIMKDNIHNYDSQKIKKSISKFYEENYLNNLINEINKIIEK